MSDYMVWAFESNVGFTNRLLLSYFTKKCSNKELMYVIIHSSFTSRKNCKKDLQSFSHCGSFDHPNL